MSSIFLFCHCLFKDDSKVLCPATDATVLAVEQQHGHVPQHLRPWAASTGVAGCVLASGRAKAPSHVIPLSFYTKRCFEIQMASFFPHLSSRGWRPPCHPLSRMLLGALSCSVSSTPQVSYCESNSMWPQLHVDFPSLSGSLSSHLLFFIPGFLPSIALLPCISLVSISSGLPHLFHKSFLAS